MSDEDLRKWDSDVRGTSGSLQFSNSSSPDSKKLYSTPSVTRLKSSQRSLRDQSNRKLPNAPSIHTNDVMVSIDNTHTLGASTDDGDAIDVYVDDNSHQNRYSAGGGVPPDHSFAATQLVHLTRGNTAYKIIESEGLVDERGNNMDPITIVCLHGLTDSSYIWEDIAEVLSSSDAGPCARVVVFDFYGRGR